MLTPEEIRKKTLWYWNSGKVLRAMLRKEKFFPLRLAWGRPTAKQMRDNFSEVRQRINEIREQSGAKGLGYTIEWQEINHRQLGPQQIPAALLFELKGFLRCADKEKKYAQLVKGSEINKLDFTVLIVT